MACTRTLRRRAPLRCGGVSDIAIPSPSHVRADEAGEALAASRTRLAVFMIGAGVTHFVAPSFYTRIVPKWMPGDPGLHVVWSGLAEILAGTLVAVPKTRRVGAWLSLLVLVVVYPANVQMAVDAGRPKDLGGVAVWARLPMQIPMWRLAYRLTR